MPDRLQTFTEGLVEEPLATEPAGWDPTQERETEVSPLVQRPKISQRGEIIFSLAFPKIRIVHFAR